MTSSKRRAVTLRTFAARPDLRRAAVEQCLKNAASGDVRAKMSAAKRGNWADPDYRARQSAAVRRGKAHSFHRIVEMPN